jgi:retron-type reverse transcriptase
LLDPYYEAKFSEHVYSYRKGRDTHQAVGFLKAVLQKSNIKYFNAILIDIEKCFNSMTHQTILTHFNIPSK